MNLNYVFDQDYNPQTPHQARFNRKLIHQTNQPKPDPIWTQTLLNPTSHYSWNQFQNKILF